MFSRSQFVTLKMEDAAIEIEGESKSQITTLRMARGENIKYLPYAFTENGIAMLSGVLKSTIAIQVNIQVMRAFVSMRKIELFSCCKFCNNCHRWQKIEDKFVGTHEPCVPTNSLLSRVVAGLKRSVTIFANENRIEFGWQSRFYDHIIRDAKDRNEIANYIEDNITRWELHM